MKKLLAVLLTLAMLLGLAACGTSGGGGEPTIVGTWKGSMDMGSMLSTVLQMDIDEPLEVGMTFTFNADGTYSVVMDKDSIEDMMDTLVDVVIEVMLAMTDDPDMDLEAQLAAEGMTMAEFKEQIKSSMDLEEMLEETETTGYYKYEDGKCYTAEDKEDLEGDLEGVACNHITLTSNTMTITEMEQDGEKMSELMPDMFPMVFTKQ